MINLVSNFINISVILKNEFFLKCKNENTMKINILFLLTIVALFSCSDPEILPGKYPSVQVIVRAEHSDMKGLQGVLIVNGQSDSINSDSLIAYSVTHVFNRGDNVSVSARLKYPGSDTAKQGIIFELYSSLPEPTSFFFARDLVSIDTSYTFN